MKQDAPQEGVPYCQYCRNDPEFARLVGDSGLALGRLCPVCQQPTCQYHLTTVRWRWRDTGSLASTLVCQSCVRRFDHRHWDAARRDWIT